MVTAVRTPSTAAPTGCYGFSVQSPFRLHYLREGGLERLELLEAAAPEPEEGILIYEWTPTPGHVLHARLYQDGARYRFWVEGMGTFLIDPAGLRITVPPLGDAIHREERLWGWPTILCFLQRGDFAMHAASADVDGAGIVLGAPGRFGKTTLATALHLAGYRVLSEDLSCLRSATLLSVVPGPAMLRIRQDVMRGLNLQGGHVVREDSERCSVAITPDRRGTCDPVPLRAVVLLRESPDGIRIERVPFRAALPDLWSLSFHLPNPDSRARCFSAVVDVARYVSVWNVYRPLTHEDLPETVDRIVRDCLGKT